MREGRGGSFTVRVPAVDVHCENGVKNTARNVFWEKLKVVACRCWCYMQYKRCFKSFSFCSRDFVLDTPPPTHTHTQILTVVSAKLAEGTHDYIVL